MKGRLHFSKKDTNVIKGIGMLLIMFHNFFHLIEPATGENEFSYDPENFNRFIHYLQIYPYEFIRYLFSYLGYYGVYLFIFISSYGLYLGYKDKHVRWWPFMKKRLAKLYPILVIAIIVKLSLIIVYTQHFPELSELKSSLLKLTFLFNFFPHEAWTVSGPWWFFSLIVQLYIFVPLLLRLTKKFGANALLFLAAITLIITIAFNHLLQPYGMSLYATFIGQFPVFCLGMYFASRPVLKINNSLLFFAGILFIAGNLNVYAWHLSFLSITILMLGAIILIIPFLEKFRKINSFIIYTGSISLFLFAIHGMLRRPFVNVAETYNNAAINILIALAFVAVSYVAAWVVMKIENVIQRLITSKNQLTKPLQ